MSNENPTFVTRADYPEQIASDESLTWDEWTAETDNDRSFVGEVPDELLEDPEQFAYSYDLPVLREGSSPYNGALEIIFDLGVGVVHFFKDSVAEEWHLEIVRPLHGDALEAWMTQVWLMDDQVAEEEAIVDAWFEGFTSGPHVVGEEVISFSDYDDTEHIDIVHTAEGRFALNGRDTKGPCFRIVDTLAEARGVVERQFEGNFSPKCPSPKWEAAWEAAQR